MNQINSTNPQLEQRVTALAKEIKELAISDEVTKRTLSVYSNAFASQRESIEKLYSTMTEIQQTILKMIDKIGEKSGTDKTGN